MNIHDIPYKSFVITYLFMLHLISFYDYFFLNMYWFYNNIFDIEVVKLIVKKHK